MRWLWDWLRGWLGSRFWQHRPRFKLVALEDIPEERSLKKEEVYVVGPKDREWCILLICPCGCGDPIYLNLLKGTRPAWELTGQDKAFFSVCPSIHRTEGCRSHFFITKGTVQFVHQTDLS